MNTLYVRTLRDLMLCLHSVLPLLTLFCPLNYNPSRLSRSECECAVFIPKDDFSAQYVLLGCTLCSPCAREYLLLSNALLAVNVTSAPPLCCSSCSTHTLPAGECWLFRSRFLPLLASVQSVPAYLRTLVLPLRLLFRSWHQL